MILYKPKQHARFHFLQCFYCGDFCVLLMWILYCWGKDSFYSFTILCILHQVSVATKQNLWNLITATTAERFFRIDKAQESLHYITDISSEDLYVLDSEMPSASSYLRPEFIATNEQREFTFQTNDAVPDSSDNTLTLNFTFPVPVSPPKSPTILHRIMPNTM